VLWIRFSFPGGSLFPKFDTLGNALQYAFPEVEWDLDKFAYRGKKAGQRSLKVKLEELLPGKEVIEDYLHPDLIWSMLNSFRVFAGLI
jgi:hypothetical protein